VAVLAFAGITVALVQTLVIPLLPHLPRLVGASAGETAWAVTGSLLAGAVATPVAGRLADMIGKRRMLLACLGLLVAGSCICALSTSLVPLVVGRVIQGLAAAVIPLGISVMRDVLPADRLASGTATMSASLGVGGALGLPAASLVAQYADWHILFWSVAGLGAVAVVLVLVVVPESPVRSGGRFDAVGAAGLSVGLVCLLLAISYGADRGWTSAPIIVLFVVTVLVLLLWARWELRSPHPLVDLRINTRRQVLVTNAASAVFAFSMFAQSLVLPQLLQMPVETGYGLGRSILVAGLVMGPSGLVMMAMAPVSARITRARGPKVTLMVGAVVVAAGYLAGTFLMSSIWEIVLISATIGAGIGLGYGAMPALVMAAVPVSHTAAANSLNTLMRAIGTSVASAVAGAVLAHMTITAGPLTVPSEQGFRVVMALGAAAALGALALAAGLPRQSPSGNREKATANIAAERNTSAVRSCAESIGVPFTRRDR
jgi:MFS family permease